MAWSALVLGGGGAKGEFQVGVLQHLRTLFTRFDFHAGVSVGALNASYLAQFDSFADGVLGVMEIWDSIKRNRDVYESPVGGELAGALATLFTDRTIARDAIFSSKPLRKKIADSVEWNRLANKSNWAVGVTSLTDGEYYVITNHKALLHSSGRLQLSLLPGDTYSIPDHIEDFILASASMPLLFPPVDIYGHRFMDGGLRDITPLSTALDAYRHYLTNAQPQDDDTILVISCLPRSLPFAEQRNLDSGREILLRALDVMSHEIVSNDLETAELCNQWADHLADLNTIKIVSIQPDRIFGLDSLDFENHNARKSLRAHGLDKAQAQLG